MRRFLVLLVVIAAGIAAAAFVVPTNAATVNGSAVSTSALDDQLAVIAGSPGFQCYLGAEQTAESAESEQSTGGTTVFLPVAVNGTGGSGTYATAFASTWLFRMVETQLLANLAASEHLTLSPAVRVTARRELLNDIEGSIEQLEEGGVSPPPACDEVTPEFLSTLPGWFTDQQVQAQALNDVVLAHAAGYSSDQYGEQQFFTAHRSLFDAICVQQFQVTSQAAASALQSKVNGGTPLATVIAAQGDSVNHCYAPSSSGYSTLGQLTQGLVKGQASQPYSDDGQYLVFVLTNRKPSQFGSVKAEVREALMGAGDDAIGPALKAALGTHGIRVDSRFGTWDLSKGIVPPISPPERFVLSPAVDVPVAPAAPATPAPTAPSTTTPTAPATPAPTAPSTTTPTSGSGSGVAG